MRIRFFHIACVLSIALSAQDTSLSIDPVNVFAQRLKTQQIALNTELLKTNSCMSFADLLQKQSGLFIRRQSISGLSTISYQGLGTMHIPIIVAGQNMQSSMNGTMDLSLISAYHFDHAGMGSGQDALGSQSLGPGLELSKMPEKAGFDWTYARSRWDRQQLGMKLNFGGGKWNYAISTTAFKDPHNPDQFPDADSNFHLKGKSESFSAYQKLIYRSEKEWLLKSELYLQRSDRSLPFFGLSDPNNRQTDRNLVLSSQVQKKNKEWSWKIKHSVWREMIHYQSELANINARSTVWNSGIQLILSKVLNKTNAISYEIGYNYANYRGEMIEKRVEWNRPYASFSYMLRSASFYLESSAKLQASDKNLFSNGQLNLGKTFKHGFSQIEFSRVYRLPVLNELYWYEPGFAFGNPELQPEYGYRLEWQTSQSFKNLIIEFSPYMAWYKNLIEWRQSGVLQPMNINNVSTVGLELTSIYSFDFGDYQLNLQSNLNWVSAQYGEGSPGNAQGNQLIYTPEFTANLTVSIKTEGFGAFANAQFVSKNYFRSDNSAYIQEYALLDLGVYAEFGGFRTSILLNNLFDESYSTMVNFPMQGRTINIQFNYHISFKE